MLLAKANRTNEMIRISPIVLIDQEGKNHGEVPTSQAQQMAREAGMDLVEVSPNERPPVCRIMDYGKQKYSQKKKRRKTHSHDGRLKELRLRPKTDDHDREIKMNRAVAFLKSGHKVQFTMLFRGRERAHRDRALEAFDNILEALGDTIKVERPARMDGRRMTMVIAPIKK